MAKNDTNIAANNSLKLSTSTVNYSFVTLDSLVIQIECLRNVNKVNFIFVCCTFDMNVSSSCE